MTMETAKRWPDRNQPDENFSPELLARLWPNRVHESNWLKSLACRVGLHRWHDMELGSLSRGHTARFCRWCSKVVRLV